MLQVAVLRNCEHGLIHVYIHIHAHVDVCVHCDADVVRRTCANVLNINGRTIKSSNSPTLRGGELSVDLKIRTRKYRREVDELLTPCFIATDLISTVLVLLRLQAIS